MIHSLKKLLKSNYLFTLGILICLGWILAAVLAPVVAPYDPIAQDLSMRLKAPSAIHWFGTDNFGRDIFSRVIYGGRYSLLAGCLSVIIAGISCPITLAIFGTPLPVLILCILSVALMTWRHKENIKRLIKGTEPKFSLKSKKA